MPVESVIDPPEHAGGCELPRFTRAETEVFSSYARSRVGEKHGDRTLQWGSNPDFDPGHVRFDFRSFTGSLGCINDYIRSEPGSWVVVGMIPNFKHKVAERAGRPKKGPTGCARRKIHLLHQCYSKLLEGVE